MKKFFSLVLALVMVLSLTTAAWGADPVVKNVSTNADLAAALKDTAAEQLVINLSAAVPTDAASGEDFFTIEIYGSSTVNSAIKSVTINGTNKTKVSFANLQVQISLLDKFTINDCEILEMKTKGWGHLVFGGSKAGGVYTISDCLFTGVGTQGIYINSDVDGAQFIVKGCTFTGDFGGEGAVTLQNNSEPTNLTVTNNDFDVAAGSEELTVHYHKEALTLNADVDETVLIKAGPDAETAEENFAKAVATADAGDTFKLMADVTLAAPIAITTPITIVENGNDLVGMPAGVTDGTNVNTDASGKLTSGTFAAAPAAADVADGHTVLKNTDGTYVVVPAVTMGDKFDLYAADSSLKVALAAGAESVSGLSFTDWAAKSNSDGSGNVAYIAANNGEYYVKTTNPTVADYAVTVAGKTDVLYYVSVVNVADVQYGATAKAFTNFGTKCGQLYRIDTTKEYYVIEKAEAGFALAKDDVSYVVNPAARASYVNVLVGNEIKTLAAVAVDDNNTVLTIDEILGHNWAVTGVKATTTGKTVPTQVTCLNCGAVVTKFYDAAGKVPAGTVATPVPGYEQATNTHDAWFFVEPAAASVGGTVVTPSTDKTVTSADTFDAGIAMYVGMSVMAAAGSAVVIGKKKD